MGKLHIALGEFLSDVVMTGYYLAEPPRKAALLHDAEMKCLKIIYTLGPLQMHEVARYMYATKPRATQLVATLEKHGYVSRSSANDHRVKVVAVTNSGKLAIRNARRKYMTLAESIEQRLGVRKTEELCALLAEITPLTAMLHATEMKEVKKS